MKNEWKTTVLCVFDSECLTISEFSLCIRCIQCLQPCAPAYSSHLDISIYPEQPRDRKACEICANQCPHWPHGPQQEWCQRCRCLGVSVSASAAPSRSQRAAGPCSTPPPGGPRWTSGLEGKQKVFGFICRNGQKKGKENSETVVPLLKARTLWCSPLVWQVSFLPGSSFIMARFWFQWHQFTSSTLIHQ